MVKRVATALVGLPILVLLLYIGGIWLGLALLVMSLVGLWEFFCAVSPKSGRKWLSVQGVAYVFTVVYYVGLFYGGLNPLLLLAAFMLALQFLYVLSHKTTRLVDALAVPAGFFYIPVMFSFVWLVREGPWGLFMVWPIFIAASGSDTAAFLVGRQFGRHKLADSPSPGKSWEGCVGGALGAAALGFAYGWFAPQLFPNLLELWEGHAQWESATAVAVITSVAAVFSQFGDLFASAIKRAVGIKDYAHWLPGHGGALDRFDSILVTGAVVYLAVAVLAYVRV